MRERRRKYCSRQCLGNAGNGPTQEIVAAQTKRRAAAKRAFVKALGEHGTLNAAAKVARISLRALRKWRKEDPKFDEAWTEAIEVACDRVEQSLIDRCVNGTPIPITYKGRIVAEKREYDTVGGMFWLKGRRPHVFGDRVGVSHSNADGTPLVPSLTSVQIRISDSASLAAIKAMKALPAPSDPLKAIEIVPTTLRGKLAMRKAARSQEA